MATGLFEKSHVIPREASNNTDESPWYLELGYFYKTERSPDEPKKKKGTTLMLEYQTCLLNNIFQCN